MRARAAWELAQAETVAAWQEPEGGAPLPALDRPRAELSVLDITKWYGEASGGVRTYLEAKARYVAERPGLRHALVIPGPHDSVSLGEGRRVYRLRGPRIPTQTSYRFLLATRSTRRIIEHERPDIIEVGSPIFVPWVTALATRQLGTPMVTFYHTSLAGALPRTEGDTIVGRAWRAATSAYLRRLGRVVRRTIVASRFAADELHDAGVSGVVQIPLGVDLHRFNPARRGDAELTRRHLGLPPDRPLVLYVGRLAPEKRLEVLLDAWPAVERATGAHLLIVGAGSHGPVLRSRAPAGRVLWLPFQDDREVVARLHAAVDVYVAPGDVETFGLSALEAAASGTPVVSADRGAVAERVRESGGGLLYLAASPNDLAQQVVHALASAQSLGARGRAHAEREHDWRIVFDRLFDLYREVVKE